MASVYIRNRCYSQRIQQTPFYLFTNKKPDLRNMKIFGTVCYAYENQPKKKLDSRVKKGVFVGYDKNSPAFLVYHPETQTIRRYRIVKCVENEVQSNLSKPHEPVDDDDFVNIQDKNDVEAGVAQQDEIDLNEQDIDPPVQPQNVENVVPENVENLERPVRDRKLPKRFDDYFMQNTSNDILNCTVDYCYKTVLGVPNNYEEAMSSKNAKEWKKAMEREMASLKENDTFTVVELPEGKQSVGGRWVFALKDNPDGTVRYKARYVAKGYTQIKGIDYYETFSPTAKMTSLRILIQLAAQYGMCIHQLDVKTAYLNAPIDCEIYVEQPKGFETPVNSENLVWKLNRSLYGLKQSGRNWNSLLHDYLIQNGFIQSLADSCVYTRNSKDATVILLVWVDDIIIATNGEQLLLEVKNLLKLKFKMTDLGRLSRFLGIQFKYDGGITMDQTHYLKKILSRYNMENCKPKATPSEQKLNFSSDLEITNVTKYREMIGSLIYAMTCTRPDLCWIVTKLSQYLDKPTSEHHTAVKHVLRYIRGTLDYKLYFGKTSDNLRLIGYADADWGTSDDRKSTTGYCFKIGNNIISWRSKKQQTVALSSCEAEYMALASATQEALFLMKVLKDMDNKSIYETTTLYGDNQGALALSKNPVDHQHSRILTLDIISFDRIFKMDK